jgi:hypothetical protein
MSKLLAPNQSLKKKATREKAWSVSGVSDAPKSTPPSQVNVVKTLGDDDLMEVYAAQSVFDRIFLWWTRLMVLLSQSEL